MGLCKRLRARGHRGPILGVVRDDAPRLRVAGEVGAPRPPTPPGSTQLGFEWGDHEAPETDAGRPPG